MRAYSLHLFLQLARLHLITTDIIETNFLNLRTPDFQAAAITTSSPPTPENLEDNSACLILGVAIGICASLTQNFIILPPTVQAQCLCYSSTLWQPNIFDAAVNTCAEYASTAVPTAYAPLVNLEGFCNDIGDIEATTSAYAAMTTTGEVGVLCSPVDSFINSCAASTTGFATLQASDQAKCLCYSNNSWVPSLFDGALNTCCQYAQTAEPSVYSVVSALGRFCQSVGNVLATTTSVSFVTPSTSPASSTLITLTTIASPILNGGATSRTSDCTTTSTSPTQATISAFYSASVSTTHTTLKTTSMLTPKASETGKGSVVRMPASLSNVVFVSLGFATLLIFLCLGACWVVHLLDSFAGLGMIEREFYGSCTCFYFWTGRLSEHLWN